MQVKPCDTVETRSANALFRSARLSEDRGDLTMIAFEGETERGQARFVDQRQVRAPRDQLFD